MNEISFSHVAVAALVVAMTGLAPRSGAAQMPGPEVAAAIQGELGDQVLNGCNTEVARFCVEVAPGEGRLLACLYAHGDELSRRCDYALYNAAARLERAIWAMTYVRERVPRGTGDALWGMDAGKGAWPSA
jgi:hypothetical protein